MVAPLAPSWHPDGTVVAPWRYPALAARPAASSPDAKAWVPPGPKDVLKDKIDGVNRDPKSPEFLRPAKDSPLATAGAGNEDPALPSYIGALPPHGAEPWDWDRTWRALMRTVEDKK